MAETVLGLVVAMVQIVEIVAAVVVNNRSSVWPGSVNRTVRPLQLVLFDNDLMVV